LGLASSRFPHGLRSIEERLRLELGGDALNFCDQELNFGIIGIARGERLGEPPLALGSPVSSIGPGFDGCAPQVGVVVPPGARNVGRRACPKALVALGRSRVLVETSMPLDRAFDPLRFVDPCINCVRDRFDRRRGDVDGCPVSCYQIVLESDGSALLAGKDSVVGRLG
jgi:hypothetical protein